MKMLDTSRLSYSWLKGDLFISVFQETVVAEKLSQEQK
jgi:hypothetical protein